MFYYWGSRGILRFFKTTRAIFYKMSEKSSIERIKLNAQEAKNTIDLLKNELAFITKEYNNMLAKQLKDENAKLLAAVEDAKKKLIQLEVENGVKQIPIPTQKGIVHTVPVSTETQPTPPEPKKEQLKTEAKPKKEKKPKEVPTELPIDIGRLDLRAARIIEAQRHPDADSLYVLKINCGEEKPRTVCSGLVKYVPIEHLQGRAVMLLCNLKPVKMRGIMSEAMVMCASTEHKVEVLIPPGTSQPGDLVHCEGFTRQPDAVMNPKKKIFETVAPDLHINDKFEACYKGTPLIIPGKGTFVSLSLLNVPVK